MANDSVYQSFYLRKPADEYFLRSQSDQRTKIDSDGIAADSYDCTLKGRAILITVFACYAIAS